MRIKFYTIKKKTLCLVFAVLLGLSTVISMAVIKTSSMPKPEYTIVIDAGHGGKDGGAVGKTSGVTENELNLLYAETLKDLCERYGFGVVMTRNNLNGLYSPLASNKKRSDMEARQKIIEGSDADLVISVHMNAFPLASSRGAHVFYGLGNESGKELAQSIQTFLHESFEYAKSLPNEGDFFILNCTPLPGALVEFGFLSNPEEEQLLLTESYRKDMCYAVLCGVLQFFEM